MNRLKKYFLVRKWQRNGYTQCFLCDIPDIERGEKCKMIKKYDWDCWFPYIEDEEGE